MENPAVTIREAEAGDLQAIKMLYCDLHETELSAPQSELSRVLDEIISDKRTHLFILFSDGKAASTCILSVIPNLTWDARPYGILENVVTKKEFRNMGFGKRLLRHALDFAWENRCYKVMLLTGRKEEHVFRLYNGAGFVKEGKTGLIAYSPDFKG